VGGCCGGGGGGGGGRDIATGRTSGPEFDFPPHPTPPSSDLECQVGKPWETIGEECSRTTRGKEGKHTPYSTG
jgi:hypothetical protein